MLPAASVVHLKINVSPTQPWQGNPGLSLAGLTAKALANVELRLGEEAASLVGYLISHAADATTAQIDALKIGLDNMAGNVGLVKAQTNSFDSRGAPGGSASNHPERFGMDYPIGDSTVRRDLVRDVVSALGIPPMLFDAQSGTAAQEGYRILYASTLEPYSIIMAAELAEKLGTPNLRLMMDRVAGSDIMRRAGGFAKLKEAGVPEPEARRIAGVR